MQRNNNLRYSRAAHQQWEPQDGQQLRQHPQSQHMCQQHPDIHPQPLWSMEDEDEVVDEGELAAGDRVATEQEDAAAEYLHHHHQLGESSHPRQQEQHQPTNQTK